MTPREAFDSEIRRNPMLRAALESVPPEVAAIATSFWQSGFVAGNMAAITQALEAMSGAAGERETIQ